MTFETGSSEQWQRFPPEKRIFLTNIALLAAFQTMDVITTKIGVTQAGINIETNPIFKALFESIGPDWGLLALKVPATLLVIGLAAASKKEKSLRVANIIYSLITLGNAFSLYVLNASSK